MFHRPVLDRVLELEPRTRARGLRNVPSTLDVFDSHFPRFPVLPGVVVLDSLAELARLVLPGAPEAWRLSRHATGHLETAAMRAEIVAFLRRWL